MSKQFSFSEAEWHAILDEKHMILKQRDELLQLLQRAAKWFINDDDAPLWVLDVRAALSRIGKDNK